MIEKHLVLPAVLPNLPPKKVAGRASGERLRTLMCAWLRQGKCPIVLAHVVDCLKEPKVGCPITSNTKTGPSRTSRKIDLKKIEYYLNDRTALAQWMLEQAYGASAMPKLR